MVSDNLGLQEVLRRDVVVDAFNACVVTSNLELFYDDITMKADVHNGDLALAVGESLILHGHAYSQALRLDNEAAADVAFSEVVRPIYLAVAGVYYATRNPGDILETNPDQQDNQRIEWNIVMHKLRTLDGDRVLSPFGIEFAEEVATGGIIVPKSVPLMPEHQERIDALLEEHQLSILDAANDKRGVGVLDAIAKRLRV